MTTLNLFHWNTLDLAGKNLFLKETLTNNHCKISFTKIDGTVREMPCTLKASMLPALVESASPSTRVSKLDTMSVWCTDKAAWRSFRVENVTAVEVLDQDPAVTPTTNWVVDLEEDPESGDLFMPIPPDLLTSLGWEIGDVLTWDVNEDTKEVSLTKG